MITYGHLNLSISSLHNRFFNNIDWSPDNFDSSYFDLHILPKTYISEVPLNGKLPVTILYNMTPKAHISALIPEYQLLFTISGHIYDGVPQNILSFF